MNKFNLDKFTKKIAVNASLEKIYDAWAKPNEIERWFLKNADYYDENNNLVDKSIGAKQNNSYNWSWYLNDSAEVGTITEANGKDFIQFTFAGDCLVEVELKPQKDIIMVELTQKNIKLDDESAQSMRLDCESGWSFYLLNLKSIYEGGLDLRNKDTDLRGMVNN
jgi:uncharacterized protein YndB with AHSA1/START domain